jgi:3-oxoacid CoA-transferase B subunit
MFASVRGSGFHICLLGEMMTTEKKPLDRQTMCNRLAMEFQDGWPLAEEGEEDIHLVNAGGQHVTLQQGAAIIHHADSFSLIRSGYVDVTVMGAYEVAENGDFANWKTLGRKGGGIGGAMDLAVGAKQVFLALEHTTREGLPRLLKRCTLPVTALAVVSKVVTNLGLFDITPEGFLLREVAPGYTPEDVQAVTEAKLIISPSLKELHVT